MWNGRISMENMFRSNRRSSMQLLMLISNISLTWYENLGLVFKISENLEIQVHCSKHSNYVTKSSFGGLDLSIKQLVQSSDFKIEPRECRGFEPPYTAQNYLRSIKFLSDNMQLLGLYL